MYKHARQRRTPLAECNAVLSDTSEALNFELKDPSFQNTGKPQAIRADRHLSRPSNNLAVTTFG